MLDPEAFIRLPAPALRLIFSHLDPWDLLNLADAAVELEEFIASAPKHFYNVKFRSFTVTLERGGRLHEYNKGYFYERVDSHRHGKYRRFKDSRRKSRETYKETLRRHYSLLLTNCYVDLFVYKDPAEETLRCRILDVQQPVHLNDLQNLIEKCDASALRLDTKTGPIEQMMEKLGRNEQWKPLKRINSLQLKVPLGHLEQYAMLKTKRFFLTAIENSENATGRCDPLFPLADRLIKEWASGDREIDFVYLSIRVRGDYEHTIGDESRAQMAEWLKPYEGRQWNSLRYTCGLIKRDNHSGLLIADLSCSKPAILLIGCDYNTRSRRFLQFENTALENEMQMLNDGFKTLKVMSVGREGLRRAKDGDDQPWEDLIFTRDGAARRLAPGEVEPPKLPSREWRASWWRFLDNLTALENHFDGVDARERRIEQVFTPISGEWHGAVCTTLFDDNQHLLDCFPNRACYPPIHRHHPLAHYLMATQFDRHNLQPAKFFKYWAR
ncbi:unnamed protein product, partial [Mesorhabditis spiculigera]